MSQKQLDALHEAAAAAREGMGVEERTAEDTGTGEQSESIETPEIGSPETEMEAPEVEQTPAAEEEVAEDAPAESEQSETEEESQPGTSVYQELNKIRGQKRTAEAATEQILKAIGAGSVEEAMVSLKKLKENQPVPEAFVEFAKAQGIEDPKVLKATYDLFSAETKRETSEAINALREEFGGIKGVVEQDQSKREWQDSLAAMDTEWEKDALPLIQDTYKPDAQKVTQAHTLMAELAHSEKYHDKELEYILYKEAPQFEAIFGAPKRRTMLPARGAARSLVKDPAPGSMPKPDGSHEGIMKAREALGKIKNSSAFGEDSESI